MYTSEEIRAKLEERKRVGDEVRGIYASATGESREITGDESAKIDGLLKRADSLKADSDRMERSNGLFSDLGGGPVTEEPEVRGGTPAGNKSRDSIEAEYRQAFTDFLSSPGRAGAEEAEARAARLLSRHESRSALQLADGPRAGYMVAPVQFLREFIKNVDDEHVALGLVRKHILPMGKSLSAPKRTARVSTFARGGETAAATADTAARVGQFTLQPTNAWGEVEVSNDLLESDGLINIEAYVREELALDAGDMIEQELMTGGGGSECMGLFTASDDGIPTGRDVVCGSTTALTFAGCRDVKYGLKAQYWRRARWLGSRTFHKQAFGLLDSQNRPIYIESTKEGEPDRFMGHPIHISEFAPSTFTTGLYVGMFADFSTYWLAWSRELQIRRLVEVAARQNLTIFRGGVKVVGAPTLTEAFSRAKLG